MHKSKQTNNSQESDKINFIVSKQNLLAIKKKYLVQKGLYISCT